MPGLRSVSLGIWVRRGSRHEAPALNGISHFIEHTLFKPLERVIAQRALSSGAVDWFLPHYSSEYFRAPVVEGLARAGLPIPEERWFTNLERVGNVGSASIYIMLDELMRSGRLRNGQHVLCWVPESGRFSSGFIYLTVVAHA